MTIFLTVFQLAQIPISIKEDSRGNIWVLCQGNLTNNENPSISIIETNTNLILKSFSLTNNFSYPSSLEIDIQTNQIYFINKHIYKIQNLDDTVANEIWFNNNNNFYNLKINPYTKDVYITDAKDYVQNGTLYIIDSIGNL